jgi:hypothetical protein
MISFSSAASTDVTMGQSFKVPIKTVAYNLAFGGWTCSERGLANALAQNASVTVLPGENVTKVIVFFTDGLANTFNYTFNCGNRNIVYNKQLYDPNTGAEASSGCTIPATISSINPARGSVDTSDQCGSMQLEAADRAVAMADLARTESNIVFCVGMGSGTTTECGQPVPNLQFLARIANSPDSPTYNPSQPSGNYVIAANAAALPQVFQDLASKILWH